MWTRHELQMLIYRYDPVTMLEKAVKIYRASVCSSSSDNELRNTIITLHNRIMSN